MKQKSKSESIVYVGSYVDGAIFRKRGLRSANAAGSNRLMRLANALNASGVDVLVISQTVCLRQKFVGRVFHSSEVTRVDRIPYVFSPDIALPILGAVFSPVFLVVFCLSMMRRRSCTTLVIYNFSIALFILCLFTRMFTRIRILHNVEDVSIPKLADWKKASEVSAVRQIVLSFCMKLINWLSFASLVPSRRFIPYLATGKNIVVSGCISTPKSEVANSNSTVNILFSGKIQYEYGAEVVVETVRILSRLGFDDRFRLIVTGENTDCHQWLRDSLSSYKSVQFLGFLPKSDFEQVLADADICLSLQNDRGRFSELLVPSKTYEFLSYGKAVIATRVGDLSELEEVIRIVAFEGVSVANEIISFLTDRESLRRQRALALEYSRRNFTYSQVGKRIRNFLEDTDG